MSCRTTARAELDKTFRGRAIQTVQTIKPFQTLQTFTLKQLPQQAPQGQGHSNDFLWAFKAAVCQPANAPNPSKIPNTFPNRHPRAKATSPTGTPGPRPQQWLSIGFQSCRLPARKRSKHSKTFQTLQTLQNPPNPPNTVPSRHPRAKATSRTGTPGPRPQQWLSMGFQSCRLPARKRSKPSKTLQTLTYVCKMSIVYYFAMLKEPNGNSTQLSTTSFTHMPVAFGPSD